MRSGRPLGAGRPLAWWIWSRRVILGKVEGERGGFGWLDMREMRFAIVDMWRGGFFL